MKKKTWSIKNKKFVMMLRYYEKGYCDTEWFDNFPDEQLGCKICPINQALNKKRKGDVVAKGGKELKNCCCGHEYQARKIARIFVKTWKNANKILLQKP